MLPTVKLGENRVCEMPVMGLFVQTHNQRPPAITFRRGRRCLLLHPVRNACDTPVLMQLSTQTRKHRLSI